MVDLKSSGREKLKKTDKILDLFIYSSFCCKRKQSLNFQTNNSMYNMMLKLQFKLEYFVIQTHEIWR